MVNAGYQSDDRRTIDYELWPLPGTDLLVRGPRTPDLDGEYFVAIGAAQTFGRFVDKPFCQVVSERIGCPALNLGFSGAGPTFFLERKELLDLINRARFAVVQVMSGRSVSNSRFIVQENQGVLRKREVNQSSPNPARFAEDAYIEFLKGASMEDAVDLREEARMRYVSEMNRLLRRIKVPKILLYWSGRQANYSEGLNSIESYWGEYPHFVNEAVLSLLREGADKYVEAVSKEGLPQLICDRATNEPLELWSSERFPTVTLRHHNHYYPSPEMHGVAAAAIEDSARELLGACRKAALQSPSKSLAKGQRHVVVHHHIFKNAGSSIDRGLQSSFGAAWRNVDPTEDDRTLSAADLASCLEEEPNLRAISSHQLRPPLENTPRLLFFPILFLRHPIDRVASIYHYERMDVRQQTSVSLHTRQAAKLSFKEFVEWCLAVPGTAASIANYQTRVCSISINGANPKDWFRWMDERNLAEAQTFVNRLPVVGIVERFRWSVEMLNEWLSPTFPELWLDVLRQNSNQPLTDRPLAERLAALQAELGPATYGKLVQANALDLRLYRSTLRRFCQQVDDVQM